MINVITSKGRVADRAKNMIEGALLTADAIKKKYNIEPNLIGEYYPIASDDWTVSLPQAKNTLNDIKIAISKSIDSNKKTILLSNTCSVSLASLPVVAQKYPDAYILWIDAHGDFNTPNTTDSGYLGGMVLAAVCGLWDSGHGNGVNTQKTVIIGARDIDPDEKELIENNNVRLVGPQDFTPDKIIEIIGDSPVWIHVDWDVLEPGYLPADYCVKNGIIPEQIKKLIQKIPNDKILGIELAEFNASDNKNINDKAIEIILDTISPLFK